MAREGEVRLPQLLEQGETRWRPLWWTEEAESQEEFDSAVKTVMLTVEYGITFVHSGRAIEKWRVQLMLSPSCLFLTTFACSVRQSVLSSRLPNGAAALHELRLISQPLQGRSSNWSA